MVLFLTPGSGRFAVVAGRRVGGAVQRNRARRILREAWRQIASQVPPEQDAVRMMSRVAVDLESVVRANPTQWFNFYSYWGNSACHPEERSDEGSLPSSERDPSLRSG